MAAHEQIVFVVESPQQALLATNLPELSNNVNMTDAVFEPRGKARALVGFKRALEH